MNQPNVAIISNPKGGIEIEVLWSGRDVMKCEARCSNGRFSGAAHIYVSHDDLRRMAEALHGFPHAKSDSRDFELGTFNPALGWRWSPLRMLWQRSARPRRDRGKAQRRRLLPVEAASIDSFLTQVRAINVKQSGVSAFLPMA